MVLHVVTKPDSASSRAPSPAPSVSAYSSSGRSSGSPTPGPTWRSWIEAYAQGKFDPLQTIRMPEAILEEPDMPPEDSEQFTVLSGDIGSKLDRSSPEQLLQFYHKNGYLPSAMGPHEDERIRLMKRVRQSLLPAPAVCLC